MATETVLLNYEVELGELRRELAKMPGISSKEAKKMVNGLKKEFDRATKEAKKAAKAQKAAMDKAGESFEGVKRITDAYGGSAAATSGAVEHLGKSFMALTGSLGPMGAVMVAATAIATGFAAAGISAALNAHELAEELEELGREPVITDQQRMQVDQLDAALGSLWVSTKELTVVFGAEFAPAVTTVVIGVRDLVDVSRSLIDTWMWVANGAATVGRGFQVILSMGMSEVFRAMGDDLSDYADAEAHAALVTEDWRIETEKLDKALADLQTTQDAQIAKNFANEILAMEKHAAKQSADMQREEESELKASLDRQDRDRKAGAAKTLKDGDAMRAKVMKGVQEFVDREEKIVREHAELTTAIRMEAIARQEARRAKAEQAEIERMDRALERNAALAAHEIEQRDMVVAHAFEAANTIADFAEQSFQRQMRAAQEAHAEHTANIASLRGQRAALFADLEAATTASEKSRIKSEIAVANAAINAQKSRSRTEKEEMLKAFRRTQALQAVMVMVNGAAALISGYAQTGPPPTPGGIAVTASLAVSQAASLATIAAQKPPAINHDGAGLISAGPDNISITARDGEAMLNQRGAEAMGRDNIDAMNRGTGGMMNPTFVLGIDGRAVAKGVARQLKDEVADMLGSLGGAQPGYSPVYGI